MTLDIASLRAIREREATTVSLSTNPAELDRRLLLVHVDTLEHRIRELEAALREVCDELDYYGDQAGEYFREKGGCDETLAKARALLPAQDRAGKP